MKRMRKAWLLAMPVESHCFADGKQMEGVCFPMTVYESEEDAKLAQHMFEQSNDMLPSFIKEIQLYG